MFQIKGLTRRFGEKTAVKDVTLNIINGQMVGIIGRSGAGKSTLLRMLNRLVDPSEGKILHDGIDITALNGKALRDWRRDCAMIFQQFNLVPRLDVLTNVLLGRLNHRSLVPNLLGIYSDQERAEALMALERLGIAEIALQRAGTLSGGQQQRVAIARALMQQPKVMLADEPIASLDPLNAKVVMDSLKDINEQDGITVITNLHTLDTARNYCGRVIGMAGGAVVFDGPAESLTEDAVRMIYGVGEGDLSEDITSTSIKPTQKGGRNSKSTEPLTARKAEDGARIVSPA
ncbi:MAG: phosphonate ABC transporter ATP-binding protein [Nitratireductor sp.]